MRLHSNSTSDRPFEVKTYAVYDADGVIVHIHSVITVEGAQETSDAEAEQAALKHAEERGLDTSGLNTLAIDGQQVESGIRYRVDPVSRSLRPVSE
jgi:hypothetical protein